MYFNVVLFCWLSCSFSAEHRFASVAWIFPLWMLPYPSNIFCPATPVVYMFHPILLDDLASLAHTSTYYRCFVLLFHPYCFSRFPSSLTWRSCYYPANQHPFILQHSPLKPSHSAHFHTSIFFLFLPVSPTSVIFNGCKPWPFLGCHRGAFNKVLHPFCAFPLILQYCCHSSLLQLHLSQ